jgi:hypothetical protein
MCADLGFCRGLLANLQSLVKRFICKIYEHNWMLIICMIFVACMVLIFFVVIYLSGVSTKLFSPFTT